MADATVATIARAGLSTASSSLLRRQGRPAQCHDAAVLRARTRGSRRYRAGASDDPREQRAIVDGNFDDSQVNGPR
jgi:TetR/AcrR family transcriptional repressor of bet genes